MSQATAPAVFPPAIVAAVKGAALDFFTNSCGSAKPAAGPLPAGRVMGVISFFGDPVWSFALVLPEATAVAAAHAFAGFDIPFDGPDMGDMVGEMCNVMAGDVVARLDAVRIKAQMSLPTVARGQDVELLPPANSAEERLELAGPAGPFLLRLFKAEVGAPAGYNPGR